MDQTGRAEVGKFAAVSPHRPEGVISTQSVYTIDEAKARLRWTDSALRAAKRRGLQLLTCGKRRYVTGAEILRFLESMQRTQ